MSKKILVITYYWPPSGGSGVQRWLKFVKYLVRLGWEPYVFTPENPHVQIQDASLLKDVPDSVEVIKFPIWEPYQTFNKLSSWLGKKSDQPMDFVAIEKRSPFQKISAWVRGNFFIPDARMFWVKPSVAYLSDFLIRNQIEKIVTTGPPHSVHLIGLKLKKMNNVLHWIADFRDPWSEWDLLDTFSLSLLARKKHQRLEREVLQTADQVITVTPYYVKRFEALSGRQIELITNGFDEDDFKGIARTRTSKFTIRHIGGVDELRDPKPAMLAIKAMCMHEDIRKNISVEFVGAVNSAFRSFISDDPVLNQIVSFKSQIPHAELLRLYGSTDVLLLVLAHMSVASGNIPGKLFEYLASGNQVVGVGAATGDAAQILKKAGAGVVYERENREGMAKEFLMLYHAWKNNDVKERVSESAYSREALTLKLIDILNEEKST